ncbi:MAG TPA: beta-glucosidase BglX [Solirubrobacteraceae bacterium]|jgi:beta-glucosidase|nr:beta-glucosidase BglX [Solirubrobacteraceae bacterium]
MAERVLRAVGEDPRRRIGFGTIVALVIAAAVLVAAGVFTSAPSAQARARTGHGSTAHRQAPAESRPRTPNNAQINADVTNLMSKLTVQDKFGQLEMAGPTTPLTTLEQQACDGQVGSVLDLTGVASINAVQQATLAPGCHPRIPLIFSLDVIHGYKTMFPVPLAEASSWDPALVANDESVSASEASADGLKWTFNPMVDIARDPRWGRVVEGAGEDPYLGSAIAVAKVRGYQGNSYAAPDKMAATIKHFAAYGAPVAGREYNTVDMSTQQLFNDYLPPYKAAVDAGVASVMSSFNSLDGVPNTANPYTLTTILRDEWGFGGTVVSDYQAVQELEDFGYASNGADAARLALTAGLDIEMAVTVGSTSNPVYSTFDSYGPQLLSEGKITMQQLDAAVRHVLTLKYLAGMFTNPYPGSASRVASSELTPANLAAAKQSADESQVLLQNNNHALPLSTGTSSIAVVGPLADAPLDQLGPDVPIGYDTNTADLTSPTGDKIVTVLQGIKNDDPGANVTYAQGCDPDTTNSNGVPTPCDSDTGFPAAVAAAKAAQETVIVVGEPSSLTGEASSRTDIGLPGDELELIQDIAASGAHYVVDLMNGRPLTLDWLQQNAPAVLESWFPGTEGGQSVADILFGKVDPSGKLPMTFPVNVGQIPITYNELPTGRPCDPSNKYTSKYLDAPNTPLYPFGYGLSYTTFSISSPHLSSATVGPNGQMTVTATVSDTGSMAGADVAQLYLHESDTSILQPVEKLEGFQRVQLNPGQSKTVTFKVGRQNLGFYNEQGQFTVEPGQFNLWVSDTSQPTSTTGCPASLPNGVSFNVS